MDKFDALRAFVGAADARSFAAAGRRLGRTRDAVSKAIAYLEADVGTPLFHRTTRRLELTDAGSSYLERVRPAVLEVEAADALIRSGRIAPHGRLRVNAPMAWGNAVLAPLVPAFLQRFPDIELDLCLDDRQLDPIPAEVDITLRISAHRETALASEPLGEIRRALFASREYLDRAGRPTAPGELANHACLHYGYLSTGSEWVLRRGPVVRRVRIRGPLASNSGHVLAEAALDGAGIAQLPTFIVDKLPRRKALEVVLRQWRVAPLQLHAIVPPLRQISGRVRSFCDYLRDTLATRRTRT